MRTALSLALLLATAGASAPAASPPEIVFESVSPFSPLEVEEIVTMDLDGGNRVQRTDDGTNKFLPHFSPDGTRIVYTKFVTGGYGDPSSVTAIAVYELATGRETMIVPEGEPSAGNPTQPVWSPDGSRIVFGSRTGGGLWMMNGDGSDAHRIARPSGAPDDIGWGDPLWSRDDWIYFTVAENVAGCFKVRIDRMRPDGSERTKITDGGGSCTPPGFEQSGDADPGISPDGKTLYSSRGLPLRVPGFPQLTIRHLYAFSNEPWHPGKEELDVSGSARAGCIAGVPKVSPDGTRVLLFLFCPDDRGHAGVTLTDTLGASWKFISQGFGPDWNPVVNARSRPLMPLSQRPNARVVPGR